MKGNRPRGDSEATEILEAYFSIVPAHKGSLYTSRQLNRSDRVSLQLSWSDSSVFIVPKLGEEGALCILSVSGTS